LNFPLYIARRYLFSKKSHNAINVITMISMVGVLVGTMALVVVLSVFNGFDDLIRTMFSSFDPELKITPARGKVFDPGNEKVQKALQIDGIGEIAHTLEENTLISYEDKQYPGIIKGVSDNFAQVSGIDTMLVEGKFILKDGNRKYAVIGQGLAYYLSYRPEFVEPLTIYFIDRDAGMGLQLANAVKDLKMYVSGVFMVEQTYDSQYLIIPIEMARNLLGYTNEVSAMEIKLEGGAAPRQVQDALGSALGSDFVVKNRYQQNEAFYKIMKTEKWAIFFILLFILIIASFNVIGSLSMLVLDKRKDIATLHSLGADHKLVKKIFIAEGWMISFFGVVLGILLGIIVCWVQIRFGIVTLNSSGSFIIDAYPVVLKGKDLLLIFITVNIIGFFASIFPIHLMAKKYQI
jgi:lipoprotein-releasing system permease protein